MNTGTPNNIEYTYLVAGQDKDRHAIPLMNIDDVNRSEVISDAKNKMEVTIQSLCGTPSGKKAILSTIKGLENLQPTDTNGNRIDWIATIYSSDTCAS